MKLWLLKPLDIAHPDSPWRPWHDRVFAMVIRASSEDAAREMAASRAGAERCSYFQGTPYPVNPWKDTGLTSCLELLPEGEAAVIIRDALYA